MRPWFLPFFLFFLCGTAQVHAQESSPTPPALLLAEVLQGPIDLSRYWVSEKLDGVRALWNGRQLSFRSGRPVPAPAWFTAALPPGRSLDGELWLGRRQFDRLSGIVRKQAPMDQEWRLVRYMLFELPDAPGSFSERIGLMKEIVASARVPWLNTVEQFKVADREALMRRMAAVVRGGGEGLMLHLADAPYLTGRSDILLKVKPWLDAEATVVGHVPGRGKYSGMLGALEVQAADGRRFRLGTGFRDEVRANPPPVGSIVTYRFRELNKNGLPRFASFLRVRETF